jgi:hypothetical protein
VTEPPDDIDNWLARDVRPLPPPPGTFERIHRRARRRKLNQALLAGAGAVVVVAGAVLIPAAATGLLTGSSRPEQALASPSSQHPARPSSSPPTPSARPTPSSSGPALSGTALSTTTSGAPAPAGFQPTSITMISESVGAVIGQAGTPGHCGPPVADDCTSLAGTSDFGSSWYGVSAPVTGAPDGAAGVSQLRFLNLSDGWAFGPQLYATADGGRTWTAEPLPGASPGLSPGLRVTGLEAAGDRAFVIGASCAGTGSDWADACTSFSLYSTVAGSDTLTPVPVTAPAGAMSAGGQAASAMLAIAGDAADPEDGTGYLLAPSGDILRGSVGGGGWSFTGRAPCTPDQAMPADGAPSDAQLAIGPAGTLLLACDGTAVGSQEPAKRLWASSNGGASWASVSTPPPAGEAMSLAGTSAQVLLATTAGIDYAATSAGPWTATTVDGGVPPGGFSYVGMTSATHGIALPVRAALGEVFISTDGGQTWVPHRVSG